MVKSPFLVHQRLFTPKLCEEISDYCIDLVDDGMFSEPVNNEELNRTIDGFLKPSIGEHFKTKIVEHSVQVESYTTDRTPDHICESCTFSDGKWYRVKDLDFVTVVFLKDHLETVNETLDNSFEVYGGKLEFPTFNFGFEPERGTAVTYPAFPNFLNTIANIKIGQLNILRIFHRSDTMFVYEPSNFQGDLESWFKDLH